MKFKQGGKDKHKVRASLDMTPLIDVVFQLVIFFMVTSSFVTNRAIPIEMPQASDNAATDIMGEDMTVSITVESGGPDGEGVIYINDLAIQSWVELQSTLEDYHADRPEGAVTLRADRRVPSGRTVEVIGYITGAGVQNLNIAADKPEEGT